MKQPVTRSVIDGAGAWPRALRGRGPRSPWVGIAALLAAMLGLAGCQIITIFAVAFPSKTKPVYKLADKPTLIMVEDPDNQLPDPSLAGVIATAIYREFAHHHTVKLIDPKALHDLMETNGDNFDTLPLDRIAFEVHAQQVFHVAVEGADLNMQGDSIMPTMSVRVKIVDASKGRLFPASDEFNTDEANVNRRGYLVAEKLPSQMTGEGSSTDGSMAMRKLAERLGTETAQLFFSHTPPPPRSMRDD